MLARRDATDEPEVKTQSSIYWLRTTANAQPTTGEVLLVLLCNQGTG